MADNDDKTAGISLLRYVNNPEQFYEICDF